MRWAIGTALTRVVCWVLGHDLSDKAEHGIITTFYCSRTYCLHSETIFREV